MISPVILSGCGANGCINFKKERENQKKIERENERETVRVSERQNE